MKTNTIVRHLEVAKIVFRVMSVVMKGKFCD